MCIYPINFIIVINSCFWQRFCKILKPRCSRASRFPCTQFSCRSLIAYNVHSNTFSKIYFYSYSIVPKNKTNGLISRTFKVILLLNFTIHIFSQKTIPIMRKRFDMTADGCRHIKNCKGRRCCALNTTKQSTTFVLRNVTDVIDI